MRVKGLIALLTSLLIGATFSPVSAAADLPSFEIKSVSSTMIDPGDTVTWKIQINLVPGWLKGLTLNLIDPSGQVRQLYTLVESVPEVKEKKSVEIALSLKTHDYDLAGKYRLQWGYLVNVTEVFYYDPINGKDYANKTSNISAQNFNQFDFTIRDAGAGKQKSPQYLESLSFTKTQVNPGSKSGLEIKTSGTGSLVNASITFSTPDGTSYAYCDASNSTSSNSCQDLVNQNGKYSFSVPVWTSEDSSPGTYRVTQVSLGYRNSESYSSSNDTANWGGSIYYYETETEVNGVKSQVLSQFLQNGLSFTLLDAGQGPAQTPIWTELAWKSKSVQAGTTATLIVAVNGFNRFLGNISIPMLFALSGKNEYIYTNQNGQEQVVRQIKPSLGRTMLPATKSGTFEVDVYIPRSAKPGNYSIGQLNILSTSCQLSNMKDIYTLNSLNGQNCQSWPNGWHTSFYMGGLTKDFGASGISAKQWTGYVNPLSVQIEVTAAAPLQAPKMEELDNSPTSITYRYQYSNEQTCSATANPGDLVDENMMTDGFRIFKVNNLSPNSDTTVKLTCTDATGAKAESSINSKTAKPIPPASPKIIFDSATSNSALFSIGIREGFKYSIKAETGEAQITGSKETGYKIEVSGLKPGIKTYLIATITDAFEQSTSTEPIYFSAELPPKPAKPVITVGKVTTTRVEFKYVKLPDLDYELSVSEGSVSDIKGSVSVSGLSPNTKIIASVKVIDQFGQSVTSDEYLLKSAIPDLPAIPALFLTKATSASLTLRFTPRSGMSFFVKVSRGIAKISGGSIYITGLSASEKVEVILIMNDEYGQQKISEPYKYTTAQAPKVATKTTIICIKAKASKVITAINPTCPTGYTKK